MTNFKLILLYIIVFIKLYI